MRIEIRGRNTQMTDAIREHVNERFEKVSKQVADQAQMEVELLEETQPGDRRRQGRRGHAAPEGDHAARQGGLGRPDALDRPLRREDGATGQALPRQAPQPPRQPGLGRLAESA